MSQQKRSPVYLTITADLNLADKESIRSYASQAVPMFSAAGGSVVLRTERVALLAGDPAGTLTVLAFPSADAIRGVFGSDAYQGLLPARERAFRNLTIAISEDFDPATKLAGAAQT